MPVVRVRKDRGAGLTRDRTHHHDQWRAHRPGRRRLRGPHRHLGRHARPPAQGGQRPHHPLRRRGLASRSLAGQDAGAVAQSDRRGALHLSRCGVPGALQRARDRLRPARPGGLGRLPGRRRGRRDRGRRGRRWLPRGLLGRARAHTAGLVRLPLEPGDRSALRPGRAHRADRDGDGHRPRGGRVAGARRRRRPRGGRPPRTGALRRLLPPLPHPVRAAGRVHSAGAGHARPRRR